MYAEGRADSTFTSKELDEWCEKIQAPYWFKEAVENQKIKLILNKYEKSRNRNKI